MPIQISYDSTKDSLLEKRIEQAFDALDVQFSTYKEASDVSRYAKNMLPQHEQDALFLEVLKQCESWRKKTNGYFDAFYSGSYDPSGIVKALGLQQAKDLLEKAGIERFLINASGDIVACSTKEVWEIGIQHPTQRHTTIGTISAKNLSVATSGSYERGRHIINPKTQAAADSLLSVTVIGEDIVTADVLATALYAAGQEWQTLINAFNGYEALVIADDGTVTMSGGFTKLLRD